MAHARRNESHSGQDPLSAPKEHKGYRKMAHEFLNAFLAASFPIQCQGYTLYRRRLNAVVKKNLQIVVYVLQFLVLKAPISPMVGVSSIYLRANAGRTYATYFTPLSSRCCKTSSGSYTAQPLALRTTILHGSVFGPSYHANDLDSIDARDVSIQPLPFCYPACTRIRKRYETLVDL